MHKKHRILKGIFWGQIPFPKFPFKINVQISTFSKKKAMVTTCFTYFSNLEHYDKTLYFYFFYPKSKKGNEIWTFINVQI